MTKWTGLCEDQKMAAVTQLNHCHQTVSRLFQMVIIKHIANTLCPRKKPLYFLS